ncbi:DUF4339 domain-containing protein [Bacteroidota bacterium]
MSDTWYYFLKDDRQYGPFTYQDLLSQLISPDTLIWYEGLDQWQPAGDFQELSGLFHTPSPPPPPSSPQPPPSPPPQSPTSSHSAWDGSVTGDYMEDEYIEEHELTPPELSVLAVFAKITPGLFSKKPKFNQRLTRFYLVYQFQSLLVQNPANQAMSESIAGEIAAREISEGIAGLVQKGLATENAKGIVLTERGFSFISQDP